MDDDLPPEFATAFVAQDFQDFRVQPASKDVKNLDRRNNPIEDQSQHRNRLGQFHHTIAKCLGKLSHRMKTPIPDRVIPPSMKPEPLSRSHVDSDLGSPPVNEETAQFVSQGAEGIVDLGASLSVIGESHSFKSCAIIFLQNFRSP